MRLIATFEDEQRAYTLNSLLEEASIESSMTSVVNMATGMPQHQVWVVSEDDVDKALDLYEGWLQDPQRVVSQRKNVEAKETLIKAPIKVKASSLVLIRYRAPLTRFVILLCVIIFLWTGYQKAMLAKTTPALLEYFGLTSLVLELLYDVPEAFEKVYQFFIAHPQLKIAEIDSWPKDLHAELTQIDKIPYWQGFYARIVGSTAPQATVKMPPFKNIAQGELWRLFTPALLHSNFLHILFNMLWLWLLGKEVESKIGKIRYVILMLILGVICNTAQYVMSGPLFMGYSGVICGLGGFIWVRQKKAPWEGYTIPPGTLLFLFIFILGMLLLQIVGLIMSKMHLGDFAIGRIGNTAHLVGAICGLIFARMPFFYRLKS